MGSIYRLICMNHDPAFAIEAREWQQRDNAVGEFAALKNGEIPWEGDLEQHRYCDLSIGRWSGALVEVGCASHMGRHIDPEWVKADWLRLLHAAYAGPYLDYLANEEHEQVLGPFARGCWPAVRATRLWHLLGLTQEQTPGYSVQP